MAQIDINNLKNINKERNTVHEEVYATYTVFDNEGQNIFKLIHMEKPGVRILKKLANLFNLIEGQRHIWFIY